MAAMTCSEPERERKIQLKEEAKGAERKMIKTCNMPKSFLIMNVGNTNLSELLFIRKLNQVANIYKNSIEGFLQFNEMALLQQLESLLHLHKTNKRKRAITIKSTFSIQDERTNNKPLLLLCIPVSKTAKGKRKGGERRTTQRQEEKRERRRRGKRDKERKKANIE
jgi:hypothetical protein